MPRILNSLMQVYDRLLTITGYLAGLIIFLMMLIISYDVILRYFFNRPTMWVSDISTLGIPFVTLLAAAWALRKESHIKIDIVVQRISPRRSALLQIVNSIIALLACIVFFWQGLEVLFEAYQWDEQLFRNLVIPKVYLLWVFPFGALLLCIQMVRRIFHFYSEFKKLKVAGD